MYVNVLNQRTTPSHTPPPHTHTQTHTHTHTHTFIIVGLHLKPLRLLLQQELPRARGDLNAGDGINKDVTTQRQTCDWRGGGERGGCLIVKVERSLLALRIVCSIVQCKWLYNYIHTLHSPLEVIAVMIIMLCTLNQARHLVLPR